MSVVKLVCEQCGGSIVLDSESGIGTCEYCFAQFAIKEDKIVQNITQHVTKHVYGYEGKDVEEIVNEGFALLNDGREREANAKFKRAIDIDPKYWRGWYGYATTGGSKSGYLSMVPAYEQAMAVATNEEQRTRTFVDMTAWLPNSNLRSAFVRAYNLGNSGEKRRLFYDVLKVIGCDESEIARLAVDRCPNDWRAHFAMAQERQLRARWAKRKFFGGTSEEVYKVKDLFVKAYKLAKEDGKAAEQEVTQYINELGRDNSYSVLMEELRGSLV